MLPSFLKQMYLKFFGEYVSKISLYFDSVHLDIQNFSTFDFFSEIYEGLSRNKTTDSPPGEYGWLHNPQRISREI